jgi:hypothetical protein
VLQSQDVVDYYTQHGHSAAKKLFYLNKATRECAVKSAQRWFSVIQDLNCCKADMIASELNPFSCLTQKTGTAEHTPLFSFFHH